MREGYTAENRPRRRPGNTDLRDSGFVRVALQDREEVEADQVNDAFLLGAHALARELPAENAGRDELGIVPDFRGAGSADGLAGEEAPGGGLRQGAGVVRVLLPDCRLECLHIPLRRQ